jgi:hypothetical protein
MTAQDDDLMAKLRRPGPWGPCRRAAADEIDRLGAEVDRLTAERDALRRQAAIGESDRNLLAAFADEFEQLGVFPSVVEPMRRAAGATVSGDPT